MTRASSPAVGMPLSSEPEPVLGSACVDAQPVMRALGLLFFPGHRWHLLQGLKLCFNRCDIGIDQVVEQTGLLGILLATLGKFQTLELSDFVDQFLDQRLVAADLRPMFSTVLPIVSTCWSSVSTVLPSASTW